MLRSIDSRRPTGAPKKFEIARVLPIASGAVFAGYADRLIERSANLAATRFIGLFQMRRVDVVFSALAARQQFGPRAHQRLELFELCARQRMHAPRLHIAAGWRARCAFENVANDLFRESASAERLGMSIVMQWRREHP